MITDTIIFFNSNQEIVTFVTHLITFVGSFYVALHNRKLPQWHLAPLWYVGLFCLLTCITIIFQWTLGPEFPFSYWNFGQLAESMVDVMIASISLVMLLITVKHDLNGAKRRRQE